MRRGGRDPASGPGAKLSSWQASRSPSPEATVLRCFLRLLTSPAQLPEAPHQPRFSLPAGRERCSSAGAHGPASLANSLGTLGRRISTPFLWDGERRRERERDDLGGSRANYLLGLIRTGNASGLPPGAIQFCSKNNLYL